MAVEALTSPSHFLLVTGATLFSLCPGQLLSYELLSTSQPERHRAGPPSTDGSGPPDARM